jgi:selenocysteine-specific elongation factor
VLADLAAAPFMAPEAGRLRELGLDVRAIGAAARAGLLLRVTEQIVLAPGAEAEAARALAGLPQPFTAAEARRALGTTRRVAIPLLEFLDRAGITQRLPDDRRRLRLAPPFPEKSRRGMYLPRRFRLRIDGRSGLANRYLIDR